MLVTHPHIFSVGFTTVHEGADAKERYLLGKRR